MAFRSAGDPLEIFNVRSSTRVEGIPFAGGLAHGPLFELYRSAVKEKPLEPNLWLAGHGVGAAFALFAAAELPSVRGVYTFGAPRAGDAQFANKFPCIAYRVVNDVDIMETLPPPWRWRHIGKHKLINQDGSLNASPNPFNRMAGVTRQTVWLGEMLAQGLASGYPRALQTLISRVLADHAPASYQARLRALQAAAA